MPAPKFPVSVKGVIFLNRRVVLLRNGRGEWELPGGRLEAGENPADCLAREIGEELAIEVAVESIFDCSRARARLSSSLMAAGRKARRRFK